MVTICLFVDGSVGVYMQAASSVLEYQEGCATWTFAAKKAGRNFA